MRSNFYKVLEFQTIFQSFIGDFADPKIPPADVHLMYEKLITEEYNEYLEAVEQKDMVSQVDALVDMLYVIYGAMIKLGVNADVCFEEVHRSNMSKLDENGLPIFRDDGKILKGPNYTSPQLAPIIFDNSLNKLETAVPKQTGNAHDV